MTKNPKVPKKLFALLGRNINSALACLGLLVSGCSSTEQGANYYSGTSPVAHEVDSVSKPGGRSLRKAYESPTSARQRPADDARGDSDSLRPGDFIKVSLSGVPKEEQREDEFRVGDDGMISMPHLTPTRAAGLTTGELERSLESQYKSKGIFSNPSISVFVANRYVNVIGEVKQPQRVEYTNDITVLGAISACGGFTDYADQSKVRVQRRGQVVLVDGKGAIKDPSKDMPLKAGDTVEVRRSIF